MNTQKQEVKKKNIELVILYFKYRSLDSIGEHPYKLYKNLIGYVCGIYDKIYIRNISEILLSRGYFEVNFIGKSRFYRFTPYNNNHENIKNIRDSESEFILKFT